MRQKFYCKTEITKKQHVFDLDGKQNDSENSNNLKMNRESDGNKKPATFVRRTLPINT